LLCDISRIDKRRSSTHSSPYEAAADSFRCPLPTALSNTRTTGRTPFRFARQNEKAAAALPLLQSAKRTAARALFAPYALFIRYSMPVTL